MRYDLSDSLYLRTAAYEGFRAPSLNELYRPFRVGQIVTNANPALTPRNCTARKSAPAAISAA